MRHLLKGVTVVYVILLIFVSLALHYRPEENPALVFCLYLPMTVWLFPLGMLALANLLFLPRLALICLAVGGAFLWGAMGYRSGPSSEVEMGVGRPLKVMTYNQGEEGRQRVDRFLRQEAADIVAIQVSRLPAKRAEQVYPEYPHVRREAGFLLLSKFPITGVAQVMLPFAGHPVMVAVRFTIELEEGEVALYSIHLPTPRDPLYAMRNGSFLLGVVGVTGSLKERREEMVAYWRARVDLADQLASVLEGEALPVLAVGDLNTPPRGLVYRRLTQRMSDSHQVAGYGYGFSFPGSTGNPLALFRPWMRLDYLLADHHWRFTASKVESDRPSQHRAVTAVVTRVVPPGGREP